MGTRMELSRPLSSGGGVGFSLTFNELTGVINVPANGTVYVPIDAGAHRYEVKTVYVDPDKSVYVSIDLQDRENAGMSYYKSTELEGIHGVYDIVNVPASDKSGNQRLHAFFTNTGNEPTTVHYTIKIIPMSGGN